MNQSVIAFSNATARSSAITSPVEGMITYLEDSNSYQSYDGSAWVGLVPQSGNAIINGAFDIWQRGTSFSLTSPDAYTADRWVGRRSGANLTVSRQTFTLGSAPVAGYEGNFFLRVEATTADDNWGVDQLIENVRTFAGQTITISFFAKADTTRTLNVSTTQVFDSAGVGSPSVSTANDTKNLTTSWQRFTSTVNIASIAGKTLGATNFLNISFRHPVNSTGTIDIWGVQVEAGPVATPFKRNADSIQGELAACQRYYFRTGAGAFSPFANAIGYSTTAAVALVNLPVTMRVVPSSVEFSTLGLGDGVALVAATNVTLSERNANYVSLVVTAASGVVAGKSYLLQQNNSGSAFLGFSAEL
jgi:hypothetical protein